MIQLAVSPCSNPDLTLEDALAAYRALGFRRIELFTSWAKSAVDADGDGERYKDLLAKYGFSVSSLHLPPLTEHLDVSLARAVKTCRLAADLECPVVLVKGKTRADIIAGAGRLLDAIGELALTPVLQNHAGTAISTLGDYREVLDGVRDPRLKCLLEVGHFHKVGVLWRDGYALLAGRIALVYEKALGRPPSDAESARMIAFVEQVAKTLESQDIPTDQARQKAWRSLCRVVMGSNEFIYIE